eukprot:gene2461-2617_t
MPQSTNNTIHPSICNAEQLGTTTCKILVFESSNNLVTLDWYNIHEVVDEISSAYCRLRSESPRSLIAYKLKVPDRWLKDYNSSILEFEIQVTFFYLLLRLISSLQLPVLFQVDSEPLNRKLSSIFMERIYNQWNNTRSNLLPTCSSTNLFHLCGKYINTRKYHPHCFPPPLKLYPVLVTGLGGSGTHFITRELNALGFHLSHESIADQGSVSWLYGVNDYLLNTSYPFGRLLERSRSFLSPRFSHVIHVVRNPLDQVSSFTAHTNKTYKFAYLALKNMISHHRTYSLQINDQEAAKLRGLLDRSFQKISGCSRGGQCHFQFSTMTWILWNKFVQR